MRALPLVRSRVENKPPCKGVVLAQKASLFTILSGNKASIEAVEIRTVTKQDVFQTVLKTFFENGMKQLHEIL